MSTSTSGAVWARRASMSDCKALIALLLPDNKKAGERPLSIPPAGGPAPKAVVVRLAPLSGSWSGSAAARVMQVLAVVGALGTQARGQREGLARLGVTALQLQRAAEAEQREVVRRRPLDDRLELGGRLAVAAREEQRAAQRLADRRLLGLEVTRAGQRHDGGVEVAVVEKPRPAHGEVVGAVHYDPVYGRRKRPLNGWVGGRAQYPIRRPR